jgi:hypothetical protein
MESVWHEKRGDATPRVTLHELAHRQCHFGHEYALLTEGDFECVGNLCHAGGIVGDKGQDGNLLLLTLPESHAFGDGEPIEAGADLLTNERLHHRLGDRARVGDVTTEEQLELHGGLPLNSHSMAGGRHECNPPCAT